MLGCAHMTSSRMPVAARLHSTSPLAQVPTAPTDFATHSWQDAPSASPDVVTWLDQRDALDGLQPLDTPLRLVEKAPPQPVLAPTHRLIGPASLDAELRAADPLIRACYRAAHSATPRLKLTVVERHQAPVAVVGVDPADAPAGLVLCVADVLTSELVRPLGSSTPMVIITGPAF
jgi:hypothetical protein